MVLMVPFQAWWDSSGARHLRGLREDDAGCWKHHHPSRQTPPFSCHEQAGKIKLRQSKDLNYYKQELQIMVVMYEKMLERGAVRWSLPSSERRSSTYWPYAVEHGLRVYSELRKRRYLLLFLFSSKPSNMCVERGPMPVIWRHHIDKPN